MLDLDDNSHAPRLPRKRHRVLLLAIAGMLVVQPLDLDGTNRGDPVIAFDAVDAVVGDQVLLVTEGFSAMTSVQRPESPIDMAVVGVIDRIDLDALAQTPAAHRK